MIGEGRTRGLFTKTGHANAGNPGIDLLRGLAIVLVVFNYLGIYIPLAKAVLASRLIWISGETCRPLHHDALARASDDAGLAMQFQLSGRHHDVDAITSAVRSLDAGAKVMFDPAHNHLKVFASASAEQIVVKLREAGCSAQPFANSVAHSGGCGGDGCECG